MTTIQRKLWTIKDICEYTGKAENTIYEWLRLGILSEKCKAKVRGLYIPEQVMLELEKR